ncbi:MAG: hypothetical protein ACI9UN_000829 [Granulosicoccus sp.]
MNHQAKYLAEANFLDSLRPDRVVEGIECYIKQYVSHHFGDDQVKLHAIEQLCADASANVANKDSEHLAQLLRDPHSRLCMDSTEELTSLHRMKDVQILKRFGDIVFLPPNAEVIVIGDTHGDLDSTRKIIAYITSSGAIERGAFVVFLGDYANNGLKSWQNLAEIIEFQNAYPNAVVLLSGNHEFKESYLTALSQYLNTHWERFSAEELPANLQDRLPHLGNHYGHMRLDLVRSFGFEEGERLYSACFEWGLGLPCMCISGDLMISHSLGKLASQDVQLSDLLHCKQIDVVNLRQLGYETWSACRPSLHSALINSRTITSELINEFSRVLEVKQFVVGHCHYRSGDTLRFGDNSVTTIVSSAPFSPDSGHYMYQQMMVERDKKRCEENLSENDATAGYLTFATNQDGSGTRSQTMNGLQQLSD